MAHTCKPSYWGGRERKDGGSKPVWALIANPRTTKNIYKINLYTTLKVSKYLRQMGTNTRITENLHIFLTHLLLTYYREQNETKNKANNSRNIKIVLYSEHLIQQLENTHSLQVPVQFWKLTKY
jgi:hypothetical protein